MQQQWANELRETKHEKAAEQNQPEAGPARAQKTPAGQAEAGSAPQDLRQAVMAKKNAEAEKKKKQPGRAAKSGSAIKTASKAGLRWAWSVLIPSWGLSLIYINMHIFLRWVFPDLFCKLGEEWVPKKVSSEHSASNVAGTAFGIVEVIGLLLLDLIFGFVIFAALSFIIMIVNWLGKSWWDKLGAIWDAFQAFGWATMSALIDIFK